MAMYHQLLSRQVRGNETMSTQPRDTWRDWFDDADQVEQLSLDQLAEKYPLPVTADTVRYWQKAGVLPQPVKRWHDGATRALYPATYAFMAIVEIQELQERGYTLQQIASRLRSRVRVWSNKWTALDQWEDRALAMATEYTELTGNTVDHVQITFTDADGESDVYSYTIGGDRTPRKL